jgi:hypothetical protein
MGGVKAEASKLEQIYDVNETSVFVDFEKIEDNYKIFLPSRQFVPLPGISTYVHNNVCFTSISIDSPVKIVQFSLMKWIGELLSDDKISPCIQDGKNGAWAINPDRTVNLIVALVSDSSLTDTEQIIASHNGMTNSRIRAVNALIVTIPQDAIVTNEDGVQWIEEVSPPPIEELDQSRSSVGDDTLQVASYTLNISDVHVLVYDRDNSDSEREGNHRLKNPRCTGICL